MNNGFAAELFTSPLVDLGDHEDQRFAKVLTPAPEVGAKREGVSATFLENAEEYYKKHEFFDYWREALKNALLLAGVKDASTIVEYGCGFGNSTLPLLDIFPNAKIISMDISPNLLTILQRLLVARGLDGRCTPIALDVHKPYIREGVADVVVGSAILHHLVEPGKCVGAAMRVLKPGGSAIFFEPFEAGHAMLRIAIREMCAAAAIREFSSPALTWLAEISAEWMLQIKRDQLPNWKSLDDKWLFPRSVLQNIADDVGAELIIKPLRNNRASDRPFAKHLRYFLESWKSIDPEDTKMMPDWAWEIVARYDDEFFSSGLKEDLMFEGTVVFRKR
ncbi:class I SAM-dependent methyltransferase [Paraburkholderia gardini]|uniref:class I SAM-dependent methyltransferase n=1 Tax=Paraburkholderia gardini TaxID=2823469 RepID=UPI001DB55F5E|nr:class I SAM-dependent methyltransferase [Paraburkholderia gardini]CAG4889260.1 hypothetical protein R69919_00697 [Paraburkholderia gardini]